MARDDSGWVVGFHAVLAGLEGDRPAEQLWLQDGCRDGRLRRLEAVARESGVPVRRVPRRRLDEVAGGQPHNGCALRAAPVRLATLETVVRPAGEPAEQKRGHRVNTERPGNRQGDQRSYPGWGFDLVPLGIQ